jgi:hypothetical protein
MQFPLLPLARRTQSIGIVLDLLREKDPRVLVKEVGKKADEKVKEKSQRIISSLLLFLASR